MLQHFTSVFSDVDAHFTSWVQAHLDLLIVLVSLLLVLWGFSTGRNLFILGMAFVGAVGYFGGLIVALSYMIILFGIEISVVGLVHISLSVMINETIGFLNVAWLGFRHKRVQEVQRYAMNQKHPDQIIPWTAVNEIRTSLAAVRYLLFPLYSEHGGQELQWASNELSRIEQLFQEIENQQSTNGTRQQQSHVP